MSRFDTLIDRILIVGLGSIGKRHLGLARDLFPEADIRILRHEKHDDVPPHANGCFSMLDEALAFSPQLAVIATPAPLHVAVAEALAIAGCHLLIEKPLADTWRAAVPLVKQAKTCKQIFLLGYNLRYLPSMQRFRQTYNDGIIGRALSVRCEIGQYLPSWRPTSDYRKCVSARHELGGGVLLELSHELDYLCWLFGEADWVRATLARQSDLDIDVEDTAHLILGFGERSHPMIAALTLDFIRHDTTRQCTIIGETGSLRWNAISGSLEHYPAGACTWQPVFMQAPESNQSYQAEWQHMVACIAGKEQPLVTVDDGFHILKIIEAAHHSSSAAGAQVLVSDIQE
ncbi:Gfo/Idh/MocA family oxidoreductase [Polynucleobacter sp. MG-Unter2-18]|uniref:Gfo/Idh/MocA family protein n=1 Tax=Polynucleobacter sp. MG-Unter2-18 TaxID=2081052 RepID=UPI001BFCE333|nr:Gfo/Idh/MocA family oxidoreductase [Polynucleobacter sp. MG-Unter2-18]QWD94859.1 Gfo/Idh/MocA family oxidoreductase [Polynucleobacter sp. MG-Unter2-18]